MKEEIILKLEQLPESLKHSMLENFQIDGTVPITRHEMQDMMKTSIDDLKTSIEASLRSLSRGEKDASTPTAAGIEDPIDQVHVIAHYTSWTWNGLIPSVSMLLYCVKASTR